MDSLSEHSSSSHRKNDVDINLDNTSHEIESLKEQQMALMQLQHKAEKKLRDARQMQSNLLSAQRKFFFKIIILCVILQTGVFCFFLII